MEVNMTKGDRYSAAIRAAIAAQRRTQTAVALAAQMPAGAWNRRMNGKTEWRPSELETIARVLGVPLVQLIGEDGS